MSRGRRPNKRGGGASKRPARQQREENLADLVIRTGAPLVAADPLQVQFMASEWLGAARRLASRTTGDPEASLVREVAHRARAGRPGAPLVVHALATLATPAWQPAVDEALAGLDFPVLPPWAVRVGHYPVPQPASVQLWSDEFGEELLYLLHFSEPEPHALAAGVSTVGGVMVRLIGSADHDVDAGAVLKGHSMRSVSIEEALAQLDEAISMTDMYWPPVDEADYLDCRALLAHRVAGHAVDRDWDPMPEAERDALLGSFDQWLADHDSALAADEDTVELLADTFIDFGEGYLHQGVLGWTPSEVDRFLLDWIRRKVLLPDDVYAAAPQVLQAWLRFSGERRRLPSESIETLAAVLDDQELIDAYEAAADDEVSPGIEIGRRLQAAGISPNDKVGLDRIIAEYNAEQNARVALEGFTDPD